MIPHHSTALTTSTKLIENHPELDPKIFKLAEDIINTQKWWNRFDEEIFKW